MSKVDGNAAKGTNTKMRTEYSEKERHLFLAHDRMGCHTNLTPFSAVEGSAHPQTEPHPVSKCGKTGDCPAVLVYSGSHSEAPSAVCNPTAVSESSPVPRKSSPASFQGLLICR